MHVSQNFMILKPEAPTTFVTIKGEGTLEELQKLVGGYIELVRIPELDRYGIDVWINEEGKILNLPVSACLVHDCKVIDTLRGTIVFTSRTKDGDTVGLTPIQEVMIQSAPMECSDAHGRFYFGFEV